MTEQETDILKAIAEGLELETADGGEVRIYCTDGGGAFPIHGATRFDKNDRWNVQSWTGRGRRNTNGTSCFDLVIKPRTIELDFWVNVYEDGSRSVYVTKEGADIGAAKNRFACINIKRTVKEGEGL